MEEERGYQREMTLAESEYFDDSYFNKYQLFSLSEQISLIYKYC